MSDPRISPRGGSRLNAVPEGQERDERDLEANAPAENQPLLPTEAATNHAADAAPNPSQLVTVEEPMMSKDYEPVRTDKIEGLDARALKRRLDRHVDDKIPEIHIIGRISSGISLTQDSSEGAFCRFKVSVGKAWQHLGGELTGQTQVGYVRTSMQEDICFEHPIDLHFACAGLQGWGAPRIAFQVYRLDIHNRRLLSGYGFTHLPCSPGLHTLSVPLWRPLGNLEQEMEGFLLGAMPALLSPEVVYESAWKDRARLLTVSGGRVSLQVYVMTRGWRDQGVGV